MIAYFILVHRYPDQFKRLFQAIYDPGNIYLIHVDKRAGKELRDEVGDFLGGFSNTSMMKSQDVVWGGYSMVDVELRGMKELLRIDKKWDHFINLSGQDFPLKSQRGIKGFLDKNPDSNFMLMLNQRLERPITMNRIENYFVESKNGFSGAPIKRKYLEGVVPYIGGQWKILTRSCCNFICTSPKVAKFRKFYSNTLIADEGFFQTVLMNTNFPGRIVNDDKRAIIWVPDLGTKLKKRIIAVKDTKALIASGKIKLRPKSFTVKDFSFLMRSTSLFARKFDQTIDGVILDKLETKIFSSSCSPYPTRKYLPNDSLTNSSPYLRAAS